MNDEPESVQLSLFPTTTTTTHHTLTDAIRSFLAYCRRAKSLSADTIRAYKGDLQLFAAFIGSEQFSSAIHRDQLHAYVGFLREDQRHRESSIKRRIATLRLLVAWLESEGIIGGSPFHRLKLTIRLPKRLPRALEAADMRRLLHVARLNGTKRNATHEDSLMYLAVLVMFSTGVRVSELVSIRMSEVFTKDGAILVRGKGNRERRVYLHSREVLAALRRFLATRQREHESENLFVDERGRPSSAQFIRSRLRSLSRRGSITRRVTPHMLRHTAATQLLDAGVDIRFVQKLLGHSSIATTQIYTHVTDSMLKASLVRQTHSGRSDVPDR